MGADVERISVWVRKPAEASMEVLEKAGLAFAAEEDAREAVTPDPSLSEPKAPVIRDDVAHCPNTDCDQDLSEEGSINWPHPSFANLEVEEGKVHVVSITGGDADTDGVECSDCGQQLKSDTMEW
jgi:hypothetical protein